MKRTIITVVVLLCLGVVVPAAYAQAPCGLQHMVGTYVIYEKGSSAILDAASQPYPNHWGGAIAPFVAIGQITLAPDGTGKGFYWIRIGSFSGGADPIALEGKITELNEDCTGKWQFDFNLFGSPITIQERFVVFDNGREVRSIPTVTGVPAMAWVGEAHRIGKPGEPLESCGPHIANGSYVMTAENLVRFPTTPIFSDTVLLRFDVAMSGEITGVLYEKFGPTGDIKLPVSGTISVDADCSFAATLNTTINGNPATIPLRGVFSDQGKKFYGLNVNARPVGTQYSFGQGERIHP